MLSQTVCPDHHGAGGLHGGITERTRQQRTSLDSHDGHHGLCHVGPPSLSPCLRCHRWHIGTLSRSFAVVGGARSAPGQRLHLAKPGNAAGGRKTKSDVFFARSDLRYRPPGLGCGRERSVRANRENLARSRSCSQPEAALGPSEHHGVHSGDAGTGSCTRWRDWQGAGRSDEAAVPDPAPAQGGQGAAV
jgi:hypothetical protein